MLRTNSLPVRRHTAYPEYKHSGVEWLGKVPLHWHVRRLKTVAAVHLSNVDKKSVGGQEPVKLCNYLDVYNNERISGDIDFMVATATPEQIKRFSLHKDDVLITKDSESWTDIAVPALVTEDLPDVLCGYHLALVRPGKGLEGAFLARAFAAIGPRDQFQIAANGITRFGLGGDTIRTGLFAIPPHAEQSGIAAFLDRETSKIDALLAKKERLVELLQEKRTALITRAVTKGLDPTVPMKDSGIEWLGEIPAHWEISRLSTVCAFEPGKAHEPFIDDEGDFVCVNSRFVSTEGRTRKFCNRNLSPARRNDVAMVMSDLPNGRALAKAFFVTEDGRYAVNQRVCILSAKTVNPKLLFYSLNRSPFFLRYDDGINQTHLPNAAFTKCPILLPPQPEQTEIVRRLDDVTTRTDALIKKVSEAVMTLREFRTVLTSAAVTGKIDVRGEAA